MSFYSERDLEKRMKRHVNNLALIFFAWSMIALFLAIGSLAFGQPYYSRPDLRSLSAEERRQWAEARYLLRAFGMRGVPSGCRIEQIDLGGPVVSSNLVILCSPMFLPPGPRTEQ